MKGKILIIDDSITQATTFKFALTKAGFDVDVAKDGIEGIAKTYQTFPDIIISDIVMPEINGYQLCRVLKNDNLTRRIPIILLTSLDEKIDRFWGIKAGADSFFVKGKNIKSLIDEIKSFLSTTSLLSETERKRLVETKKVESTNIKSRVNQLLDQSLIESTITNEFRNLSELIHDRTFLTKGLFSLLFSILDFQISGIYFNDVGVEKKLISFSLNGIITTEELVNDVKDDFFQIAHSDIYTIETSNQYDYEIFEEYETENQIPINDIGQFSSRIIIPITYGKQTLGGLCLYSISHNHYKEDQLIKLVAEELVLLMRLRSLYIETKILAITDGLTKLFNRRYFQDVYEREFNRALRYRNPLSVVMIDIDFFKKLNDTHGHQLGDFVLQQISTMIKNNYRKTDCAARYGGEEFIVLLPETTLENALIPTVRLKEEIEQTLFKWDEKTSLHITVSIGLAELTQDIKKNHELIKRADQALYTAKENGRNRVETFEI
ncbi:MAG: diguanylate cyclase [Vampirovibrionia bacterium]